MSNPDFFIATEPLFVGLARAHNPGDRVPADNVKRNGWEDGVAREGTKAANDALGLADADGPATVPAGPPAK